MKMIEGGTGTDSGRHNVSDQRRYHTIIPIEAETTYSSPSYQPPQPPVGSSSNSNSNKTSNSNNGGRALGNEMEAGGGQQQSSKAIVWWNGIPRPCLMKPTNAESAAIKTISTSTISLSSSSGDKQLYYPTLQHFAPAGHSNSQLMLALPAPNNIKGSNHSTASSSKSSTKSTNSGTLLLTAANLAALRYEHDGQSIAAPHHGYYHINNGGNIDKDNYDTQSIASSTHFTLVNGMETKVPKHMRPIRCCCESHQLSILITCMTFVLMFTIFICIYFVQLKSEESIRWS